MGERVGGWLAGLAVELSSNRNRQRRLASILKEKYTNTELRSVEKSEANVLAPGALSLQLQPLIFVLLRFQPQVKHPHMEMKI